MNPGYGRTGSASDTPAGKSKIGCLVHLQNQSSLCCEQILSCANFLLLVIIPKNKSKPRNDYKSSDETQKIN